ncbi:MAG: restriction endonuclease [Rhodobacteraceae bacterium]|nr:restriction endonuclease [Paracoccaceae bacterium]
MGLIKAYPQAGGKKGADGGIDGLFRFGRDKEHKAIVSVKGGRNLGVGMIRDLDAVVTEQSAQIGVFLTLHNPTKPMRDWPRRQAPSGSKGSIPFPASRSSPSRMRCATVQARSKHRCAMAARTRRLRPSVTRAPRLAGVVGGRLTGPGRRRR